MIRAAIDTLARNNGKLKVEFTGSAKPSTINLLKKRPNTFQTWYQCLYRLTTILYLENTAFIVPVYDDEYGMKRKLKTAMLDVLQEQMAYG